MIVTENMKNAKDAFIGLQNLAMQTGDEFLQSASQSIINILMEASTYREALEDVYVTCEITSAQIAISKFPSLTQTPAAAGKG